MGGTAASGWAASGRRADEKCRQRHDTIGAVVVALVTRTSRGLPTEVSVGKAEGLPRPSVVNTDNILTVPRQRLVRLMGQFSSALPPSNVATLRRIPSLRRSAQSL